MLTETSQSEIKKLLDAQDKLDEAFNSALELASSYISDAFEALIKYESCSNIRVGCNILQEMCLNKQRDTTKTRAVMESLYWD